MPLALSLGDSLKRSLQLSWRRRLKHGSAWCVKRISSSTEGIPGGHFRIQSGFRVAFHACVETLQQEDIVKWKGGGWELDALVNGYPGKAKEHGGLS